MGRGLAFILMLLLLTAPAFAGEDEQRLAVLAANMQPLGGENYALDCGPVESDDTVITALPEEGIETEYYCVMRQGTDIIIGTVIEAPAEGEVGEDLLPLLETVYADDYRPHIQDDGPLESLCTGYDMEDDRFQECDETISALGDDLSIYVHKTGTDPVVIYVIITDSEDVDDLIGDPTVFSQIGDFFKGIFGITTTAPQFISNPEFREFHHAFFMKDGTREIIATWRDRTASIIYKNFVTDFYRIVPEGRAEIRLGRDNQQILRMRLSNDESVLWRRLTTGIDANEVSGAKATGVCGGPDQGGPFNGQKVIGFDEDCEQDIPLTATCAAYRAANGQRYSGGTLSCGNDCTLDFTRCELCVDADGDTFFNNTPGVFCGATVFDCNDTNPMINNSATEICDNGFDDDCDPATSDEGPDMQCQGYIPPPPFICNFNGSADDPESENCRDTFDATVQCPTPAVSVKTQGHYNITIRADLQNKPQLVIKLQQYDVDCLFGGSPISVSDVTEGTWPIYTDIAEHRILLTSTNSTWTLYGDGDVDPGNTDMLKRCWGTQDNNGYDLRIDIPKNSTAVCTPRTNACVPRGGSCVLDTDCCGSTTTSWCDEGTCQREYINPCDELESYASYRLCRPEYVPQPQ